MYQPRTSAPLYPFYPFPFPLTWVKFKASYDMYDLLYRNLHAIYKLRTTNHEPRTTNHEPRTTITSTIKVQTHSSLHPLVKCGIYFACSVQNSIHGHIDSVNANRRFDTSRSTKKEVPNYRSDMLFDVPELSGGWMGCWLVNGGWWMSELLTYIT